MSQVVSIRLRDDQMERLRRMARRLDKTPSETTALLVEESLRAWEFTHIEFRSSPAGRQAYIKGTRLAVWQVLTLFRDYKGDVDAVASHLEWPLPYVQAAVLYAEAYAEEIEAAIADSRPTIEELRRRIPGLIVPDW